MADSCLTDYKPLFDRNLMRNKVAFISGGGSGIGFTIAEILMRHGCDTVIASRDKQKVDGAADKLRSATHQTCLPLQMDVRKPEDIQKAISQTLAHFGRLDIVVNNAAGNFLCPLSSMSYNAFKVVMEIDTFGTFNVSKTAYDKYLKDHGGVILNISATLHYKGRVLQAHAGPAKAAVDALTKHMATEWGADGVRVVGIAPGTIGNTVGFRKLGGEHAYMAEGHRKREVPLQRLGTRLDIAQSALFLVSDCASYVTGHTLVVDGGEWLTSSNSFRSVMQLFQATNQGSKL